MSVERRKHTRLSLKIKAEITFGDGSVFQGHTRDISFGGAYLCCEPSPKTSPGQNGLLRLIFQQNASPNIIEIECCYIRTDVNGIAIQFIAIDIADYLKFEKMMVYNAPDPEKLSEELDKYPGLLIKSNT